MARHQDMYLRIPPRASGQTVERLPGIGPQPRDAATYLFGPDILVAPVYTSGATTREVYLPKGDSWLEVATGKTFEGGRWGTANAPIDIIPLFVRSGAQPPALPQFSEVAQRLRAAFSPERLKRIYDQARKAYDHTALYLTPGNLHAATVA